MDDVDNLILAARKGTMGQRHAAAIYDSKGNVICYAYNYRVNSGFKRSIHAEEAVIAKFVRAYAPRGAKPSLIRVIRVNKNGKLMNSKPCERCRSLLDKTGLRVEHS